jgi:hypothetical protein
LLSDKNPFFEHMLEDQLQQQAIGWLAAVGHTPLREGAELENGSVRQNRFLYMSRCICIEK